MKILNFSQFIFESEMYGCPVHMQLMSDKPGKCPECEKEMKLLKDTDVAVRKRGYSPIDEDQAAVIYAVVQGWERELDKDWRALIGMKQQTINMTIKKFTKIELNRDKPDEFEIMLKDKSDVIPPKYVEYYDTFRKMGKAETVLMATRCLETERAPQSDAVDPRKEAQKKLDAHNIFIETNDFIRALIKSGKSPVDAKDIAMKKVAKNHGVLPFEVARIYSKVEKK